MGNSAAKGPTSAVQKCNIEPPLCISTASLVIGEKKGIEWYKNSCYIDATLFAMFSFDDAFDSLLQLKFDSISKIPSRINSENAQRILKNQIVNPLRKGEMVSRDAVMALREIMRHLNPKFVIEEMEPQEFLMALFHDVFNTEPILKLTNGNGEDYFHTILFSNSTPMRMRPTGHLYITSLLQCLSQSLRSQDVKFEKDDFPAFMLTLPISFVTKSGETSIDKPFTAIFPNLTIDITEFIDFRYNCFTCSSKKACYTFGESPNQFLCAPCVNERFPGDKDTYNIRPIKSNYRLSAVVCASPTSKHFVSFAKCSPERNAPWVYFDSMGANGGLSPMVWLLNNFGTTLLELEKNQNLMTKYMEQGDEYLNRILQFPYMYIYKKF